MRIFGKVFFNFKKENFPKIRYIFNGPQFMTIQTDTARFNKHQSKMPTHYHLLTETRKKYQLNYTKNLIFEYNLKKF